MRWIAIVLGLAACRTEEHTPPPPPAPPPAAVCAPAPPSLVETPEVHADEDVLLASLADEPRIAALAGTVRHARTGELLPGATVIATTAAYDTQAAITDDDGSFLLDELPPGDYVVVLYCNTFSQTHELTLTDEPVELELTIDCDTPEVMLSPSLENRYAIAEIDTAGLTFDEAPRYPGAGVQAWDTAR